MTDDGTGGVPTQVQLIPSGIRGGTASVLADVQSLMQDISFARQCADTYLRSMGSHGQNGDDAELIKRALWAACCISYHLQQRQRPS